LRLRRSSAILPDEMSLTYVIVFAAAALSGAINSVAGGGTLLPYPVLVSIAHLDPKVANATNTMALWPASMAAAWSFRGHLAQLGALALPFSIISALGGITGAILVTITSTHAFEQIIAWLILFAALLFILHEPALKRLGIEQVTSDAPPTYSPAAWRGLLAIQFLIAVYGGYFGAGIGILMLATLSIMRFGQLFRVNALKNLSAFLINVCGAGVFAASGLVNWRVSIVMAIGATVGGLGGAGFAKKIGPRALRMVISIFGIGVAIYYVLKNFGIIGARET
jgi:uncharacterized membrane protein YfcA